MDFLLVFSPESFFNPATIVSPYASILLFFAGIAAGTLAGILGIGGGLVIVPMLTLWKIQMVQATATSLVGVTLSALSGSWRNYHKGELHWQRAIVLGLFGLPLAQVGAWLANQADDRILALSFAGFTISMIFLVEYQKRLRKGLEPSLQTENVTGFDQAAFNQEFSRSFPIGVLAGFLSGLFGIGGGSIMVPLQMVWLHEPIKSAIRTSLGAIALIAVSGLWRYGVQGNVLWGPGVALAFGGAIGAQIGTRLLKKLPSDRVNHLFRAFLIFLTVYMIWLGIRN